MALQGALGGMWEEKKGKKKKIEKKKVALFALALTPQISSQLVCTSMTSKSSPSAWGPLIPSVYVPTAVNQEPLHYVRWGEGGFSISSQSPDITYLQLSPSCPLLLQELPRFHHLSVFSSNLRLYALKCLSLPMRASLCEAMLCPPKVFAHLCPYHTFSLKFCQLFL